MLDDADSPSAIEPVLGTLTSGRHLIASRRATGWHHAARLLPLATLPPVTGYCVRHPNEITRYLRERFGRDYPAWARKQGAWPMRIGLQPPTTVQRSAQPVACHAWADQWRAYTGPGVVEYASARFPTGTHPMPKA